MSALFQDAFAQEHPRLILTKDGVAEIRAQLGKVPVFDATLTQVKAEVDAEMATGIHVPVPKDMAGGYTHERHKKNFLILQKAGVLFQLLEDEKYAIYIRDMFNAYAGLYPGLPLHPEPRSYARGKIFWQCLNDANWLVYASQAYDCIYEWLSKKERRRLEKTLFKPYADFLSVGNPQFFNRIHNHSTWGNAAVGMIGLVMNDQELVNRALYGLKNAEIKAGKKDNDGGFIVVEGQKAGFLANLESPFSPDGYYTEGPYYQRYAMYPFLIFAQALQNTNSGLKPFEYKDSVLIKAVYALLNLTDADGEFFPLNDAQKGMSYRSRELVSAVNIAYHFGDRDSTLLSIAEKQEKVQLDNTGLSVALGIRDHKATPFIKKSMELRDGPEGKQGGVGILRFGGTKEALALVMKYSAQGLSHGHYDKLSFSLYDGGHEVIQDYGLARFVNIEQKNGGGYLKENTTWAKQTIAHNTVVQNETSHFGGDFGTGSKHHSEKHVFDVSHPSIQIVSAKEKNAYPGTLLHRTMVLVNDESSGKPYVVDVFRIHSEQENNYDLPYYYLGQLIDTNFDYSVSKTLSPLGTSNGYQHLWKEGHGTARNENTRITWLSNQHFYTLTTATSEKDMLIFARLGAHDPEFNLRRDPAFMIRKNKHKNALFVSVIEAHGSYDPVREMVSNAFGNIAQVKIAYHDNAYTAITIEDKKGIVRIFILSNTDATATQKHQININDKDYYWTGPYYFDTIN
ncbi:MAG: alginate lyase family protein [Bacteroidota bacterium]